MASDYAALATAHVAGTTHDFIATNIVSNDYVTQLRLTTFDRKAKEDGNIEYSFKANYSYDGDLNDTLNYLIDARFTVDNKSTKILSAYYDFNTADVNKADKSDVYLDDEVYQADVVYGQRKEIADILDVNQYFLTSIDKIAITDGYGKELDPDGITLETTYLFGKAKAYAPSKATNLALTNVSSSNDKVVELTDDGYFEVKGAGSTILRFSYFGKDQNGVYMKRTIDQNVVIVNPKPTSIEFNLESASPSILDATLYLETTYTLGIYIAPLTAIKTFSMTNSDEKVMTVTLENDGYNGLVLTPLKEGTVTITVASTVDPQIKTSQTFIVKAALMDDAYLEKLTSTVYLFTFVILDPTYTFTLTFAKDGTGKRIQHVNDEAGNEYTDTFKYALKGTAIVFSDWPDGAPHAYAKGTITKNGGFLTLENDDDFVSDDYEAQA